MIKIVETIVMWAIPAACACLTGWAAAQIKQGRVRDDAVRMGLQALLRDRIYQAHAHYHEKGVYPIYARENVEEMYRWYHILGGNGTVTNLVHEMDKLPTQRKEGT